MGGGCWLEKVRTPGGRGQPNSMKAYKGGGGVKKAENRAYVLYGCRLICFDGLSGQNGITLTDSANIIYKMNAQFYEPKFL